MPGDTPPVASSLGRACLPTLQGHNHHQYLYIAEALGKTCAPLLSAPGASDDAPPVPLALAGSSSAAAGPGAAAGEHQRRVVALTQDVLATLAQLVRWVGHDIVISGCLPVSIAAILLGRLASLHLSAARLPACCTT